MNTEQKFLLELLGNSTETMQIPDNLDWRKLHEQAETHCVAPIFYREIQPFAEKIPFDDFDEMQNGANIAAMRNLAFSAHLIRLAEIFETNNVEYLAYKGATLARLAYGDTALRRFGDLDVLIRKRDFPKVKKILLENGARPAWDLSAEQEKAVLKRYYEMPFLFGEEKIPLEVHWAFMELFFNFNPPVEQIFERRQFVSLHEKLIPTLANEDLLIFLCVHGSKHFWTRLSWICDVAMLVRNQPIDWQIVIERAAQIGCLRMLKLGVLLACDIFRVETPKIFAQKSEKFDAKTNFLVQKFKERTFENAPLTESEQTIFHLRMRERMRDKFNYSRRRLTTKLVDSLFMPMGRPQ